MNFSYRLTYLSLSQVSDHEKAESVIFFHLVVCECHAFCNTLCIHGIIPYILFHLLTVALQHACH